MKETEYRKASLELRLAWQRYKASHPEANLVSFAAGWNASAKYRKDVDDVNSKAWPT